MIYIMSAVNFFVHVPPEWAINVYILTMSAHRKIIQVHVPIIVASTQSWNPLVQKIIGLAEYQSLEY